MENPLISVIIPVFNGELFIADAIHSVFAQKYEPLEIIVVDDGSTDGTAELVKSIPGNLRYFYQENAGVAKARNKGLEMAKGDLIAFIDADDVWVKNKLEIQRNLIKSNPAAEIVLGCLVQKPFISIEDLYQLDIQKETGIFASQLGCALIKKHVFEMAGGFDEEMKLAEDVDWLNRTREANIHIMVHKEIVQFYRMHGNNITGNKKLTNLFLLKAYKKSIGRRRIPGTKNITPVPKLNNFEEVLKYWQNK